VLSNEALHLTARCWRNGRRCPWQGADREPGNVRSCGCAFGRYNEASRQLGRGVAGRLGTVLA
jgi:hypothetical protein